MLGLFLWVTATQLNVQVIPLFRAVEIAPVVGLLFAGLMLTRLRTLLWAAAAAVAIGYTVVCYSPWVGPATRGLVRSDPLQKVEAVVVLASDIQADGETTYVSQERLFHGYELLRRGYARRLVVTRIAGKGSYVPAIREQWEWMGMDYPIDEVGPVRVTRDEAVLSTELARERGWKRVLLVSSPTHMRRSAATFRKAGLEVLSSPCVERDFDMNAIDRPESRLQAFRVWLHEWVGYHVYRMRGWL